MSNYLLNNYNLSKCEVLQSLFVSEYGLRHWAHSKKQSKWGHRTIAAIELCPGIGLVATIVEGFVAICMRSRNMEPPNHHFESPPLIIPNPKPSPSLVVNMQWFFKGSQDGCYGSVSTDAAETIRSKLDTHRPEGIWFNQKKMVDSLEDGACSAMSLRFINSYFKAKKITIEKPGARSDMLVDRIVKLGKKFSSCSKKMRNQQAAFNTIEVQLNGVANPVDYSKNKIQSLANYYSFKIDYSSTEIDVKELNHANDLSKEIESLPEGAFFIRILKPAKNQKLEEHGHSLVYIKEHGLGVFYDPNYGARNLPPSEHSKILFEGFKSCLQSFGITKARFYRLQPT